MGSSSNTETSEYGSATRLSSSPTWWPELRPLGNPTPPRSPSSSHDGEVAAVLLAAEGLERVGHVAQEQGVPVGLQQQRLDLRGTHARRVDTAHETAHAGARDVVDGDSVLLEPLQHARMRDAPRGPAAQGEADLWASESLLWLRDSG